MYVNLLNALSLSHFKQSIKMCIMAVHTTVRKKSHEMYCGVILFCVLHCCKKSFILKEITVLDFFCDSGKFLIYDTACAHIHMSYFRITHLSVRKTYCQSACVSFYKWIFCHQLVHNRCFSQIYSVSFLFVIQTISIKNH